MFKNTHSYTFVQPKSHTHTHTQLTFKHGADLPDSQTSKAGKLTKGQLEEEERNPTEHQHDEVRQHEGTWRWREAGNQTTGHKVSL